MWNITIRVESVRIQLVRFQEPPNDASFPESFPLNQQETNLPIIKQKLEILVRLNAMLLTFPKYYITKKRPSYN